jgi:hypothetical protein
MVHGSRDAAAAPALSATGTWGNAPAPLFTMLTGSTNEDTQSIVVGDITVVCERRRTSVYLFILRHVELRMTILGLAPRNHTSRQDPLLHHPALPSMIPIVAWLWIIRIGFAGRILLSPGSMVRFWMAVRNWERLLEVLDGRHV